MDSVALHVDLDGIHPNHSRLSDDVAQRPRPNLAGVADRADLRRIGPGK
jgi:hypothetical protein